MAVLLLNRASTPANLTVAWAQLGLSPSSAVMRVYDVHRREWVGRVTGAVSALIPSHDVHFVVLASVA